MSLTLLDLLLMPVAGSVRGLWFILEHLHNRALEELYDPHTLQQRLMEARMMFELGEMDETQYEEVEAELLTLLEQALEREEE